MNVLKILHQTWPHLSGYSIRGMYIANSLKKLNVNLNILSSPLFTYKGKVEEHQSVKYFRSNIPWLDFIKKVPVLRHFKNQYAKYAMINCAQNLPIKDVQLIHAHSPFLNGEVGLFLSQKLNIPLIYEVRGLIEDSLVAEGILKENNRKYFRIKESETKVMQKADHITVISHGLKTDLIARGIDAKKITIIPNGVDVKAFKALPKSQKILEKYSLQNKKVIGFIGTLWKYEGLTTFIHAAEKLIPQQPNVKFLIIGKGNQLETLQKMVIDMSLSEHFIFTGEVAHTDILNFYSVIDILVYPRLKQRNTEIVTPLKPLEAMAAEKLVVASDVGGLKELVNDGVNGLLFKSGDASDLAEKWQLALKNEKKTNSLCQQARDYAVTQRSWVEICKKYLNIYSTHIK